MTGSGTLKLALIAGSCLLLGRWWDEAPARNPNSLCVLSYSLPVLTTCGADANILLQATPDLRGRRPVRPARHAPHLPAGGAALPMRLPCSCGLHGRPVGFLCACRWQQPHCSSCRQFRSAPDDTPLLLPLCIIQLLDSLTPSPRRPSLKPWTQCATATGTLHAAPRSICIAAPGRCVVAEGNLLIKVRLLCDAPSVGAAVQVQVAGWPLPSLTCVLKL